MSSNQPYKDHAFYPESDGLPMAENTLQYRWITTIHGELDALLPDAFVAGDLFWYPIEGDPGTRVAPDVLVALGRPKGERPSFKTWVEGGPPEVVWEIRSPSNTDREMDAKHAFYERHGVDEFYLHDPERNHLRAWVRSDGALREISVLPGWASPALGIRFHPGPEVLELRLPNGRPFRTVLQAHRLADQAEAEQARAEQERLRAEQERLRAEQERLRADQEAARAERLAARLRALGFDPDAL